MLEIGNGLRTARVRRGLELVQVDRDTHIRTRYLKALEDERFDLLPGTAYVRGFLRTYANYLGLDADLFVDEYNARFAPPEESPVPLTPVRRIGRGTLRVPATAGAVLAVALIAVLAWRLDAGGEPTKPTRAGGSAAKHARPSPARAPSAPRRRARPVKLVLSAARGPCWLLVRIGSRDGRSLHEGMLQQGESLRFAGRRLWIRLGAPRNLAASLNGKPVELPDDTANIVVTTAGIHTVEGR